MFLLFSQAAPAGLTVTDNLVLHLAANNINPANAAEVRTSGSDKYVVNWVDDGPNGYNATNSTEDYQPLYIANARNGKPALRFDGTDDHLIADGAAPTCDDDYTLFIVCVATDTNCLYAVGCANSTSTAHARNHGPRLRLTGEQMGYVASPGGGERGDGLPASTNVWYVHMFMFDVADVGGDYTFGLNGTLEVWNPAEGHDDTVLDTCTIGAYRRKGQMDGNAFMWGDIAEVILYDGILDEPDIESVGAYLSEKYNITTTYWEPPSAAGTVLIFR